MSQILIHSAYGVLECKPMLLADIEHDSVSEASAMTEPEEKES